MKQQFIEWFFKTLIINETDFKLDKYYNINKLKIQCISCK